MGRLLTLLKRSIRSLASDTCATDASSIAYHTVFALFPMALIGVSVLGCFVGDAAARQQVATSFTWGQCFHLPFKVFPVGWKHPGEMETSWGERSGRGGGGCGGRVPGVRLGGVPAAGAVPPAVQLGRVACPKPFRFGHAGGLVGTAAHRSHGGGQEPPLCG